MTDMIAVASDDRGELVAVELGELPFPVQRVFVASGTARGSVRGDHVIPCPQLMVLICGRVEVELGQGPDSLAAPITLDAPGARLLLPEGQYIRYRLHGKESRVLVLAEDAYRQAAP